MPAPVCVVTGVGPGTGRAIAERYAQGGYRVALLARNADRLHAFAGQIPGSLAVPCDVTDPDARDAALARIRSELGVPSVLVHNAVGGVRGDVLTVDPQALERNFQVNVMALMHLVRALAPDMIEAGAGSIMVTGNTAARRGKDFFAGFAPTKAAQRILCESMARSLGPKGVHVAYFVIDAVIDVPWTRRAFADRPEEFFAKPSAIADTVWNISHQDRSAWSFEVDLRPFGETW